MLGKKERKWLEHMESGDETLKEEIKHNTKGNKKWKLEQK